MTENLETSLSWPKTGLVGVPAPEAGTPPGDVLGGNGGLPGTTVLPDSTLGDIVTSIAHSVDELATTTSRFRALLGEEADVDDASAWDAQSIARATSSLDQAELSLDRLARVVTQVSVRLEKVNDSLGTRIAVTADQPRTARKGAVVTPPAVPDIDPGVGTFTMKDSTEDADPTRSAVTWPPWVPAKRKPRIWLRILIALVVVAVVVLAAAVAYKATKKHGLKFPHGETVTVVAGTACQTDTSLATVNLKSAPNAAGIYKVGGQGEVKNTSSTAMKHVVVLWSVTYQDGYTANESTTVRGGAFLGPHKSLGWYAFAPQSEGTVPPASIAVTGISASPSQSACS
jgi:hypothetical protein